MQTAFATGLACAPSGAGDPDGRWGIGHLQIGWTFAGSEGLDEVLLAVLRHVGAAWDDAMVAC